MLRDFRKAEELSIPITLIVLLLAFGALVAAALPVGLALTAIAAATGLLAFANHLSPVSEAASSVMLLIGLAVGVDYSAFYLKREREERAAGRDGDAALLAAAATSGRSALISGLTVLIAMAGMFFTGNRVFVAIGEATMIVVAVSVLGSLTVLLPCCRCWVIGPIGAGSRCCPGRDTRRGGAGSGGTSLPAHCAIRRSRCWRPAASSSRWRCPRWAAHGPAWSHRPTAQRLPVLQKPTTASKRRSPAVRRPRWWWWRLPVW